MPLPDELTEGNPPLDPMAEALARNQAILGGESVPGEATSLHLSSATAAPPAPAADASLALADDKTKLKCPKCDTINKASNDKCTKCGHSLTEARKAKFAGVNASAEGDQVQTLNLGEDGEHAATVMDDLLALAGTESDGLLWKVLCKSGTLALSPGPGQVDVERPLTLTPQMFLAVKSAYDDRAFEHVTIPETHGNGTLENTGVVDQLLALSQEEALKDGRLSQKAKDAIKVDSADTMYLLGGLRFTDPKAKEKVQNGSVLNCSVGLKFGFRRKRDGKQFPIALEHVALTNQPWIDGLVPFGDCIAASADEAKDNEVPWDGVFASQPDSGTAVAEPPATTTSAETTPPPATTETPAATTSEDGATDTGDTLPGDGDAGRIDTTEDAEPVELEQLLADHQARIEAAEAEAAELRSQLQLAQGTIGDQGKEIHAERVAKQIRKWQGEGVPPAVCERAQAILLAAYQPEESKALNLSVTTGEKDGKPETTDFGINGLVEYLLSAVPKGEVQVAPILDGITEFHAAQKSDKSASEKADEVEKRMHPERFNEDGSRKGADTATTEAAA